MKQIQVTDKLAKEFDILRNEGDYYAKMEQTVRGMATVIETMNDLRGFIGSSEPDGLLDALTIMAEHARMMMELQKKEDGNKSLHIELAGGQQA